MGLITDGLDPELGLLELFKDMPFSLSECLNIVLISLCILFPSLHLLCVIYRPVLVKVLQLLLGLLEVLLQLVDLALLLSLLGQVPADLLLQQPLVVVHPGG